MGRFGRYVIRRLLVAPVALFFVATLAFFVVNVLPGNPAVSLAGPVASQEDIEQIEEQLGLDKAVPLRYVDYLADLSRGDFGRSFYTNQSVAQEIRTRLPNTLELVFPGLLMSALIGLSLGTASAYYRRLPADRVSRVVVTVLQAIPEFFMGLVLIYLLFYLLDLAPAPVGRLGFQHRTPDSITGFLTIDLLLRGDWALLGTAIHHMILPVITLGLYFSAFFAKTTRASLGDALDSRQVEFARACGLPERKVLGYALRQARTPILTYGAILFAALVGGAAILEKVFAWGGLGEWAIDAILELDLPVIQAFVLVTGTGTLLTFILLDIIVARLDPRVRYD